VGNWKRVTSNQYTSRESRVKIAILGGSFNPTGVHHLRIVEEVLKLHTFDRIIILPCGPRPDKKSVGDIEAVYRAAMLNITFRAYQGQVEIDLQDLERTEFTRTIDIERRYKDRGEVWHIVGYDLIEGGRDGEAPIQKKWTDGKKLWKNSKFVVVKREDYSFNEKDLPVTTILVDCEIEGSSTDIRNRRFNHNPIEGFVVSEVAEYIERYNLYRGRLPLSQTLFHIETPRLLLVTDEKNPKAVEVAEILKEYSCPDNPNMIVDIGGDGNKLRAIRKYWHMRLPFFGINTGHRGYLQNDVDPAQLFPIEEDLVVHHLPLLQVDIKRVDGQHLRLFGFNEVWVERSTGQSAWLEVTWNKENRIPKIVGDGLIVSTAAGSTGYAQNICGFSLPTYVRELLVVGMAIAEPRGWRDAIFPNSSSFDIRSLDNNKRVIRAFVDGIPQGEISSLSIRFSKIASVELAFLRDFDIAAKHTKIQLPYFQTCISGN
jgi:NAD+ kinase